MIEMYIWQSEGKKTLIDGSIDAEYRLLRAFFMKCVRSIGMYSLFPVDGSSQDENMLMGVTD